MRRFTLILLVILLLPALAAGKKKRTSNDAIQQKEKTEKQYAKTEKNLKRTEKELRQSLQKVTTLESAIDNASKELRQIRQQADSIAKRKAIVEDSIAINEGKLNTLRNAYVKAVRSSRSSRRELSGLSFIFSAENFRQASNRMTYIREFSRWRQRKADEITAINDELEVQRTELISLQKQIDALRMQAEAKQRKLKSDKNSLNKTVNSLKGKQSQLNKLLREQQQTINKLDKEIDRLIQQEAEERRKREEEAKKGGKSGKKGDDFKPVDSKADQQLSANFEANKGKLPSPLSHTYVLAQGFGVQQHRSIKTLQVNNTGVDLETALDATARSVFQGEVSGVFMQKGLNYVVLVRHGDYITVYANLQEIKVKKGSTVKTGDVIGKVAASPVNSNRGQLHFEIRRERDKFNPLDWLK